MKFTRANLGVFGPAEAYAATFGKWQFLILNDAGAWTAAFDRYLWTVAGRVASPEKIGHYTGGLET